MFILEYDLRFITDINQPYLQFIVQIIFGYMQINVQSTLEILAEFQIPGFPAYNSLAQNSQIEQSRFLCCP